MTAGRHEEPTLFPLPPPMGDRLRDEALERVERNAHDQWKLAAVATLDRLCRERGRGGRLSSWDVSVRLTADYPDITTHDLRALGPLFMAAARIGRIRKYSTGKHPTRHSALMTIWEIV